MTKKTFALVIGVSFVSGALLTAGSGHTFAAYSDYKDITGNTVAAGIWDTTSPASCATSGFSADNTYALPDKDLPDPKKLNQPSNDQHVLVTGKSDPYEVTLGNGNDVVILKDGPATIVLGNGSDCVITGNGPNSITLGDGDNIVHVGNGPQNSITVGNGDNTIVGGNGPATVSLGGGNNTVTFGNGPDSVNIRIDGGHNTITVGTGPVVITGSGHNVCNVPHNKVSSDDLTGCSTVTPT